MERKIKDYTPIIILCGFAISGIIFILGIWAGSDKTSKIEKAKSAQEVARYLVGVYEITAFSTADTLILDKVINGNKIGEFTLFEPCYEQTGIKKGDQIIISVNENSDAEKPDPADPRCYLKIQKVE